MRTDFDKDRYKVWNWSHPLILHWMINPGIAFNELFLGQRIPKVTLIDKQSEDPTWARTYCPCPHCGALNDGRMWSKGNGFGHWFGYVCPECEGIIPCLWNVFSILILTFTAPIWFIPARLLKPRWLAYEKTRLVAKKHNPVQIKTSTFVWGGLAFGVLMWMFLSLLPFALDRKSLESLLFEIPIWLFGGFLWGSAMWFFLSRRGKRAATSTTH